MTFLQELSTHSMKTKMDAHNIGRMFGPNLIRPDPKVTSPELAAIGVENANAVIFEMIKHYSLYFEQ